MYKIARQKAVDETSLHFYIVTLVMHCPFCGKNELKVTDSRDSSESNAIRRRRECLQCGSRFTTFETIEVAFQVHKRDGRYEEFQREKLFNGILAACRHTTVSQGQVADLTEKIITNLMRQNRKCISTKDLGEIVMNYLEQLDPVAWIRFACVYQRFKVLEEIKSAIAQVQAKDQDLHDEENICQAQ